MRLAPPVTSAALGGGRTRTAPVNSVARRPSREATALPAVTAFARLGAGAHFGAHRIARRHPGAAQGRTPPRPVERRIEPEIGLLKPANLVAQPRRLLEFEI